MDVRDIEKGHVCVGRLLLQPPGEDPGGGLQVRQAQGHHLLLHWAGLQPQVCVHLAQDWLSTPGVCTLTVLFLFPQTQTAITGMCTVYLVTVCHRGYA